MMSVTPSPPTKPVQTSSAMNARQYYNDQRVRGKHKRVAKYGEKRVSRVEWLTAACCLFPPLILVAAVGKVAHGLATANHHDTY